MIDSERKNSFREFSLEESVNWSLMGTGTSESIEMDPGLKFRMYVKEEFVTEIWQFVDLTIEEVEKYLNKH